MLSQKKLVVPLSLFLTITCGVFGRETPEPSDKQARAENLLAESLGGPDPVLIQARAKAAARLFAETGDARGEALSLLVVGSAESFLGNADEAPRAFERAAERMEPTGDVLGMWMVRLAEAEGWRSMKEWDAAIAGFNRALEVVQELEKDGVEPSLETFRLFFPDGMKPEALEQANQWMALIKPAIAQLLRVETLVEMAAVERERGRHEEAMRILDGALVLAKPFAPLTGQILVEKADVELALERPTRAMVLYEAALPVARQTVDLGLQARILRGMAEVHNQQRRDDEAAEYLERAEALGLAGQENPACWLPNSILELPPPSANRD